MLAGKALQLESEVDRKRLQMIRRLDKAPPQTAINYNKLSLVLYNEDKRHLKIE